MYYLLLFFVIVITVILFAVSCLFRFSFKIASKPNLSLIKSKRLPIGTFNIFNKTTVTLQQDGFELLADVMDVSVHLNMTTYIRVLINKKNKDIATCIASTSEQSFKGYIEFRTEFATKRKFSTNNFHLINPFKGMPGHKVIRYPKIDNLNTLYKIHMEKALEFDKDSKHILPKRNEVLQYLIDQNIDDTETKVKAGYLYFDLDQGIYRPTRKGSLLMALTNIINLVKNSNLFKRKNKNI